MLHTSRTRLVGIAVALGAALAAVAALGACSEVENALDAADRAAYIDASNDFTAAGNEFQTNLVAEDYTAAQANLDDMGKAIGEMEDTADNVSGKARTIADKGVDLGNQILGALQDALDAAQSGDVAGAQSAADVASKTIDKFNENIDAWNNLQA